MLPLGRPAYRDRDEAGAVLAEALADLAGQPEQVVLALPRGGVPVAAEVARQLGAPLDVLVVRKLGFPGQEELAIGALASGGVRVFLPLAASIPVGVVEAIVAREQRELDLKERRYRRRRAPPQVKAKRVILVDDGAATGATMIAAVAAARRWGAGEVVVALPVAAREAIRELGEIADRVVCPLVPEPFHAVGAWYARFEQLDDATVRQILQLGSRDQPARPDRPQRASQQTT